MSCQTTGHKIRAALELAGIEILNENGGGPGVRLRKRQRSKKARYFRGQGGLVAAARAWRLEFIEENEGGPGVRLKKTAKGKGRK